MQLPILALKTEQASAKELTCMFGQLFGASEIRIQHMLISVSSKIYPAVSALLPVDEAARPVYASFHSLSGGSYALCDFHPATHS